MQSFILKILSQKAIKMKTLEVFKKMFLGGNKVIAVSYIANILQVPCAPFVSKCFSLLFNYYCVCTIILFPVCICICNNMTLL